MKTFFAVLVAVPLLAGCASVPHIRTLPLAKLSETDRDPVEFSVNETLSQSTAKARVLLRQLEALQEDLLAQEDRPGLFQMLMAVGGAGAAAARLHPDALIGFGAAAAIPALLVSRYRPKDQRAVVQRGEDALRCQMDHAERLLGFDGGVGREASMSLVRQVSGTEPDLNRIFVDAVTHLRSKVTRKQRDLIQDANYASTRDALLQEMLEARKKGEELRTAAVPAAARRLMRAGAESDAAAKEAAALIVAFKSNLEACATGV